MRYRICLGIAWPAAYWYRRQKQWNCATRRHCADRADRLAAVCLLLYQLARTRAKAPWVALRGNSITTLWIGFNRGAAWETNWTNLRPAGYLWAKWTCQQPIVHWPHQPKVQVVKRDAKCKIKSTQKQKYFRWNNMIENISNTKQTEKASRTKLGTWDGTKTSLICRLWWSINRLLRMHTIAIEVCQLKSTIWHINKRQQIGNNKLNWNTFGWTWVGNRKYYLLSTNSAQF